MEALNSAESKEILQTLYLEWGIKNDHWIPLEEKKNSKEVVFYPQDYFFNNYGIDQLRKLVSSISKAKIY
jgi:predicted RNA-binding protein (virulence factor B family)